MREPSDMERKTLAAAADELRRALHEFFWVSTGLETMIRKLLGWLEERLRRMI